jgi:hypothetical protein
MKKLLVVLFLLSISTPLMAQQGASSGITFITPLQLAVGRDNNFLVDRTDPAERLFVLSLSPSIQPLAPNIMPRKLGDNILLLTLPRVAYQNDSQRHELTATYMPEFEMFQTNHDQNTWNHSATAEFTYFLSRTMEFSISDGYRSTKDVARTLRNVYLLLPRTQYRENAIRGAFVIHTSPVMNFGVRFDNTVTKFGQTDQFQARILDSVSNGFSFIATRMLQRNQRLRATYSRYTISPINKQATNDDAVDAPRSFQRPVQSMTMEYRVMVNPSLTLNFSGGLSMIDTGKNYVFRSSATRRLGSYYWLTAGFSRALSFMDSAPTLANGVTSAGYYNALLFRFKAQPTQRIGLEVDMSASSDASGRLAASSKALLGRARFDYRWNDRTVTFANLETYQQNKNDYVRTPLARNRFMVGIEYSLASEIDRRTNRLNQDGQNVPLTERQRRKQEQE